MKTELFLLLLILAISINAFPYLRKLDDETKTEAECEKDGKGFEATTKATCKVKDAEPYEIESEDECKSGTWTDTAHCSTTVITSETECNGTPSFSESKCTITINGEEKTLTDLDSADKCKDLVWTKAGCSVATVKKKETCEAASTDLTITPAKGKCVDKKSDSDSDKTSDKSNSAATSFNSFLSFKCGLVLITYLLF